MHVLFATSQWGIARLPRIDKAGGDTMLTNTIIRPAAAINSILKLAEEIDTFELSIQLLETVVRCLHRQVPKTKPKLEKARQYEASS